MNRFLKLVNFEFTRFRVLFFILMGITAIIQLLGVVFESRRYVSRANKAIFEDLLTTTDFIGSYGKMSFYQFSQTLWFLRSEEHTSELQSRENLVCRLL